MADDLTMDPIDGLVAVLKSVDIAASMDASELNLPAAWIALDEVRMANVRGTLELRCSVFLISPDVDPYRALAKLVPLYTRLRTVIGPDGPVVPQGVVLPDDPTPMPALRVPVYLYTNGA